MTTEEKKDEVEQQPDIMEQRIPSVEEPLAEWDKDEDTIPEEVKTLDEYKQNNEEPPKEVVGSATKAFIKQRQEKKKLLQAVKELTKKYEDLEKKLTKEIKASPSFAGDSNKIASSVLQNLKLQAMNNLGLSQISTPDEAELLNLEIHRLYYMLTNRLEEEARLRNSSDEIIENHLKNYGNLTEADKKAVKAILSQQSLIERVKPEIIRNAVAFYLGEKLLAHTKGELTATPSTEKEIKSSGITVAGDITVRSGVKPPDRLSSSAVDKPPTTEELKMMKKLGINDVKLLREAISRKEKYIE